MEKLKGVIVVPTEILCEDWLFDENDKFLVIDFGRLVEKAFDHEPSEQEITEEKEWYPLDPLCKEDRKAIRKYIKQNKHRFSKEKRKIILKCLKQKWFVNGFMYREEKSSERLYFTQEELAGMFDISQETVQQIVKENGMRALYKGSKPYYDFNEFKECYFRERAVKGAVNGS